MTGSTLIPDDMRAWLFQHVMPHWQQHGIIEKYQSFAEKLDPQSHTPTNSPVTRLRVQARQIYAFSHAFIMTGDVRWRDTARIGYDFLTRHGWNHDHGGWVHLLSPAGAVLDDRLDCYDQAFVLLALAWYYRATGAQDVLDWITKTISVLDARLAHPTGGYYEESLSRDGSMYQPATLPRRQNPHMHLLEAFMALHQATGAKEWQQRADAIMALCRTHFYHPAEQSLAEFFNDDWTLASAPVGAIREPGHYFEWVWLIHQYARLTGDDRDLPIAEALWQRGLSLGIDYRPQSPFAAIDEINPLGHAVKQSRRLWPQTELLKAALARYEYGTDQTGLIIAHGTLKTMFRDYLSADHGVWCDHIDANGQKIIADIPASSLYHLFVALSEWLRLCAA